MESVLYDPVVKALVFYSAVLMMKILLMSFLTARQRLSKKVFANEEDAKVAKGTVSFSEPEVERVRRCHLNGIENVYLFVILAALYCLTSPNYVVAIWHFRVFTIARIAHTISYLGKMDQPARGISFGVGAAICVSMAFQIFSATF